MNIKLTAAGVALVALVACDTAVAPTAGRAEFNAAQANYLNLVSSPVTSFSSAGGGTYRGQVISNAVIDAESGYQIVGDLNMNVSFGGGANNVGGTISNINLIDNVAAAGSQLLTDGPGSQNGGTLSISGTQSGSGISATARGPLSAVLVGGTTAAATAQMNWNLAGRVRTTSAIADTVTGTVTGGGTGAAFTNSMDVSLSNGRFYGRE